MRIVQGTAYLFQSNEKTHVVFSDVYLELNTTISEIKDFTEEMVFGVIDENNKDVQLYLINGKRLLYKGKYERLGFITSRGTVIFPQSNNVIENVQPKTITQEVNPKQSENNNATEQKENTKTTATEQKQVGNTKTTTSKKTYYTKAQSYTGKKNYTRKNKN